MSQSGIITISSSVLPPDIPTSFVTNSGTAIPVAHVLDILGTTVAAGSTPFQFTGLGNTVTGEIQISQAIVSSDATKIGLSAFNSAQFTVDVNGFVSLASSGSGIQTINGDVGSITGSTVTIYANQAANNCGASVYFDNSGTISTLNVTDAGANTYIGFNCGSNFPLTTGDSSCLGMNCLPVITSGGGHVSIGKYSLYNLSSGSNNTSVGTGAMQMLLTGSFNIGLGYQAGDGLLGSESNNICIGNHGTPGSNGRIDIGSLTTHTTCFIQGIAGVTTANSQMVTINSVTGQLGSTTLPTGTVTSVSGTLNRITSTGGTTPVIDISASYVGQSSITTLGTIGTGTWNGTAIDATHGGTAQTTWATGDLLYSSGVNTLAKLAAGSNTQVLTLAGGVPTWAAPATAGTVTSVSGTLNRITSTGGATPVIDISASYVGQSSITTLGTIATGVWNGTVVDLAHGGTNANLTASNGGIFYSTASAGAILAGTATASQVLLSGASTTPAWSVATFPSAVGTAGTQLRSNGTTGWVASTIVWGNALTANNLLYASSTNTQGQLASANKGVLVTSATGVPSILATGGTAGQVLQSTAAAAPAFSTATYPLTTTINQILYSSAANTITGLATANSGVLTTSTTGVPSIDTTNFQVLTTGVQMKGNNTNTAPPAGFIGERIEGTATNVAMVSTTAKTITSISLTAGIWDVSALAAITATGGTAAAQALVVNISTTNNTVVGTLGIETFQSNFTGTIISGAVPSYRVTLSGTTTYYLVCTVFYTSTTCPANGRLSATRVG